MHHQRQATTGNQTNQIHPSPDKFSNLGLDLHIFSSSEAPLQMVIPARFFFPYAVQLKFKTQSKAQPCWSFWRIFPPKNHHLCDGPDRDFRERRGPRSSCVECWDPL